MNEGFDEVSQLKFRKKRKFHEPIQSKSIQDASSVLSDSLNSISGPFLLNKVRPAGVPVAEYLQHIPNEWTTADKMRQLIIWFGEKALKEEIPRGRNNVADKVKKILMEKLKKSPTFINVLHNTPDLKAFTKEKNPTNIKNDKALKQYRQDIKDIKNELEQWNKCEEDIYYQHAAAMDKLATAKSQLEAREATGNSTSSVMEDDFMDHLEPSQREHLDGLFDVEKNEAATLLTENLSTMAMEMTQLRQTLSVASHMNRQATTLADHSKVALAHKVQAISRVVPLDADQRHLGLFEDTEENRKQDEFRNIESALRLLYKSKDPKP